MSAQKWHVSADMIQRTCEAEPGNCRVGDVGGFSEHFDTPEEAQAAIEDFMNAEHGETSSLVKNQPERSFHNQFQAFEVARGMASAKGHTFDTIAADARFRELVVESRDGKHHVPTDHEKIAAAAIQAKEEFPTPVEPDRRTHEVFSRLHHATKHAVEDSDYRFDDLKARQAYFKKVITEYNNTLYSTTDKEAQRQAAEEVAKEFGEGIVHVKRDRQPHEFDSERAARQHILDQVGMVAQSQQAGEQFAAAAVEQRDGKYYVTNDVQRLRDMAAAANYAHPAARFGTPQQSADVAPDTLDDVSRRQSVPVVSAIRPEQVTATRRGGMMDTVVYDNHAQVPKPVFDHARSAYSNQQQYHTGHGAGFADEIRSTYMVVNETKQGKPGRGGEWAVYKLYGAHSEVEATEGYERVGAVPGDTKDEKMQNAEKAAYEMHMREYVGGSIGDAHDGEFWNKYKNGHIAEQEGDGLTIRRPNIA